MSDLQTVYPALRYRDVDAAVAFLTAAFGFTADTVHRSPDGIAVHAQVSYRGSAVMMGRRDDNAYDRAVGDQVGASAVYVVVDDARAHHARAVAAGAEIVQDLVEQDYGSLDYTARDPEGNAWSFGTYAGEPPQG